MRISIYLNWKHTNKCLRFSKKINSFAPNIFQPTWVLIGKLFFKFDWNPNKRCWLLLKSVFSYNCEKNGARQKKCAILYPQSRISHTPLICSFFVQSEFGIIASVCCMQLIRMVVVARARGFRQKEADLKWTHKN